MIHLVRDLDTCCEVPAHTHTCIQHALTHTHTCVQVESTSRCICCHSFHWSTGAAGRRQRAVLSLLTACRESEARYLTRTLVQVSGELAVIQLATPAHVNASGVPVPCTQGR